MDFPEIFNKLYFGNSLKQYAIFLFYIAIAIVLARIVYYLTTGIIKRFTAKTRTKLDDIIVDLVEEPLVFLIAIGGFYLGYQQLTLQENTIKLFLAISRVLFTIGISWLVIRLVDAFLLNYMMPLTKKTGSDLDDVLVPLVRKIVKFMLIFLAIIMILDNMGYQVSSILAGLGLGGLAFALAAQDLLGNFFGGLTIIVDKPFKIGEYIEVGDQQGEIVEIGLRSTRLKTATGEYVTIPNRFIAEKATINHKTYKEKLVILALGLAYSESKEKIKKAKEIIRTVISKQKLVDKGTIEANFLKFGQFSFDLEVRYIINTNDAKEVRKIKDSVNEEIKELFEKNKIKLAYPTQIIRVEKE